MKLTDFIANYLKSKKIDQVFGVNGGACVHLFDSFNKKKFKIVFNHHEQAASYAVGSYFKIKRKMSICLVTTGPGATNAITGLAAAWQDSTPAIFISGGARSDQLSSATGTRQVGTQELNILPVIKSLTKFSACLDKPHNIKNFLDKALFYALEGRQGPVWLEIPLDLQLSQVYKIKSLKKKNNIKQNNFFDYSGEILKLLKHSKKPLFILGNGINSSNSSHLIKKFFKKKKFLT